MNGFRIYSDLGKPMVSNDYVPAVSDVKDKSEELMDMIFSVDPLTGFPSGAIDQYLSDKTSSEVRDFIKQAILLDHDSTNISFGDSDVRQKIRELDDDFQINLMKRRSETVEQYEERVKGYMESMRAKVKGNSSWKTFLDEYDKTHPKQS